MEFDIGDRYSPPGYEEAKVGEAFLKIGVGLLKKERNEGTEKYFFGKSYPLVKKAKTTVEWQLNQAHFSQTLSGSANGYSCHFVTTLSLEENSIKLNPPKVAE